MSHKSTNLYRWERITQPRVYSRSQRVTSDNEIKDWIRTVEDASEKAAAATFGRKPDVTPKRHGYKATVQARVEDAQLHEAAYAEAQDLLNQWVNEKIKLEAEPELSEESWTRKTQADITREWDRLLSNDVDLEINELISTQQLSARSKDPYSILKRNQDDMVAEVLDRMYDTEVVKKSFTRDLGLDNDPTKYPDPRTKMTLRHQQVKENREKRVKERERKLKELQTKKDAAFKARQMLMKEEKVKENRKRKEELEIQMEMAKIKKEMEEEKKKQEEEKIRMRRERQEMERKTREEHERQQLEEFKEKRKAEYLAEDKRRKILKKMQEIESRRAVENLKLKQKYFSAWYNMVIDKRLKTGRAKAMRDWRLLLRTFNAWKAYAREKMLSREAWAHEEGLKQFNRKQNMAEEYWRHTLLRKCITSWELFVSQQQVERNVNKEHELTKHKMESFLQAAATGKLWSARSESEDTERSSATTTNTVQKVQQMFDHQPAQQASASPDSTARTNKSSVPDRRKRNPDKPTDGWLIKREHIQVTDREIDDLNKAKIANLTNTVCTCKQNDSGSPSKDTSPCTKCQGAKTDRQKQKPWQKAPFVISNYEHRHAAQQKILEMQQKQIKEQQKLIEELQYLQKQQMLQQKLLEEKTSVLALNKGNGPQGVETIHKTLANLQAHISKLQHKLTESYDKTLDLSNPENGTVQDIQIMDLESGDASNKTTPLPSDSLRLDLSQFGDEPHHSPKKAAGQMQNKFGQTKVLSKQPSDRPSSVRSDASSNVSTKPSSTARSGASRHEQFLSAMEFRAKERERIKKEREEKRRQQEEEKMAQLLAREAEIRKQEEEEKQKRIEAFRDKKRAEKQREKEKQEMIERMKMLHEKAGEHYQRSLLKWKGIYAFKKLVAMSHQNSENAAEHYRKSLLRKVFLTWQNNAKEEIERKQKLADEFNNYLVVKTCFRNWTKYKQASNIQMQKARRHREKTVLTKVLKIWADFAAEEKVSGWHKERIAREHDLVRIKKKYFNILRKFPEMRKEEEIREKRREEMRRKVANMLSDYDGIHKSQSHDF